MRSAEQAMESDNRYIGDELELFSHASNWKNYWGDQVRPYLGKSVLEVGSGLGGTTRYLLNSTGVEKWVCLEPDAQLLTQSRLSLEKEPGAEKLEFKSGYLAGLDSEIKYDSLIYADVIEHIDDDAAELRLAASFLKEGGHLIIVVPAHQYLFSEFDKTIGHYRRYSRKSLREVIPPTIKPLFSRYLDSFGLLASLSNKVALRQNYPTVGQVKFWDTLFVPVSSVLDRLFTYDFGKTILYVGKKTA